MADNHFQAVGTPGTPTGTHLRLSSFWLYFMIYWSFRTIFFISSIASVNQIFTSVLLLLELFLDKKTLSKKSWNPLEWLKQRKWNFLKYFVFIIFQRWWWWWIVGSGGAPHQDDSSLSRDSSGWYQCYHRTDTNINCSDSSDLGNISKQTTHQRCCSINKIW